MGEDTLERRNCGASVEYYQMLESDPGFQERQIELELFTAQSKMFGGLLERRVNDIVKIPVVVHIVYRTDAEHVSDEQVNSQIKVLNEDFRARNPDIDKVPEVWKPLVADAKIEFELASKDPKGKATSGITRRKTDKEWFISTDNDVKFSATGGVDAWATDRYLNIWVCKIKDGKGKQLLGYAQFPGGTDTRTDGVVIMNYAFGTTGTAKHPFNKGRTATHEIGHWLNLRHIWGDRLDCTGDDYVGDTPKAQRPNYNDPTFPSVSCGNGPNGDMFMNYMDYVNDASMFMFTRGQVERMAATLAGIRTGFE